ncbi:hypothetical protein D9M71_234290 [compost metagenome]
MGGEDVADRALLDRLLRHARLEHIGFLHRQANPQGEHTHRRGDDERHAPAPVFQRGIAADRGQHEAQQEGHQGAGIDREPLPGTGKGTTIGRRRFDQEGRGGAEFTSGRKALGQAREDQDDRRRDADAFIVGADADHQRRQRHQQDGKSQALLAAVAVGEHAEHRAADGAHQEAHGKHRQHREQRGEAVSGRKELLGEDGGKGRVDHPVGVLDYGAEGRSHNGFLLGSGQLSAASGRRCGDRHFRHGFTNRTIVVVHCVAPVSTLFVVDRPRAFSSG